MAVVETGDLEEAVLVAVTSEGMVLSTGVQISMEGETMGAAMVAAMVGVMVVVMVPVLGTSVPSYTGLVFHLFSIRVYRILYFFELMDYILFSFSLSLLGFWFSNGKCYSKL